ncbi:lipopolysaccharide heptosyltransferase II [Mergibacter septicus]|uniref:lipopolysaccharide heptosyltransferase II n=1 Tax=Mergibacter septicus TaxID=221402 RepID=A0A8E3MH44_9PAST|nr:lipopolysaccharide heptosyltransferase II [Mergibacter septicus]AWX15874.1 lipopolysaccharide heptosyltransferase II [Mergibacter septicus]QDJ15127.1 lipopolysaccharide heptosyltransferase II [Mergibacter septicus]UTU47449.1 lipopolysaccharide heptosyltransferase II [Mergibacter septicus]WMR95370.1 lipopolysaccharide heptosyltransferase II [Mergibacter septicus]
MKTKILVVGPAWVGDMMMSHSLYQMLKQQYPQAQIDVIAPNWSRALLKRMPEVRQAIEMPLGHGRLGLIERYKIGKQLRSEQYDLAIILPNSFKSALIPLFAQIKQRRGWKGETRYLLLNDLRQNKDDYPMMVQRYVALAFQANQVPSPSHLPLPKPYLRIETSQVAQTYQKFSQQGSTLEEQERPIIAFCPGAEFGPAKRWPHYHYATLAENLINQGFKIQLFGSIKDQEISENIRTMLPMGLQTYCQNLAGLTTLEEAIDLLSGCQLVVSNDSGLMHIAAALQRPLVALYGPTSPKYTPPLAEKVEILRTIEGGLIKIREDKNNQQGYHQSLIDLSPSMVENAIHRLLTES